MQKGGGVELKREKGRGRAWGKTMGDRLLGAGGMTYGCWVLGIGYWVLG